MDDSASPPDIIGWREYVSLPDLGIRSIKVKVDTGARSSSLHAYDITEFSRDGERWLRFCVHPWQRNDRKIVAAEARVLDVRSIRSSSGELNERYVIMTTARLLGQSWPIELTLANRDQMGFRMLLGREAIRGRMLVDPGRSYFGGIPKRKKRS
ncbi:MAG: ATP-dependent zinc protease [Pirellulaceae bacterium]